MPESANPTNRRAFLERATVAAAGLAAAPAAVLAATPRHSSPDDSWLRALKGKHRQIFDIGIGPVALWPYFCFAYTPE